MFLGDWNARHRDWDEKSNKQGQLVRNWVLQWNLTLKAPTGAPTYLTPYGRSVVDFFVSRAVHIDNVTCGNGTWDSVSDHSLVSGELKWNADQAPIQNKRISKAMLKNPHLLQQAKKSYEEKLPALIEDIKMVSSNSELDDACIRFGDILKHPFESNRRPRPDRYRFFWDNHLDSLAKLRSKFYRKWKQRGSMEFWQKYKDLDKLIKRTTRDKKRALLEEFSRPISDEPPSIMAKRVNTLIKLRANRAATATERGNSLDPAAYTKYVQRAQPSGCGVSPQKFNVPDEFEHELVTTVRYSPKQRATGPDGIANEMLQICPKLSGKVLQLLWKSCGQLAYIPSLWSEGTLCPQYKKGSYEDPDNYRGLTLLSHARKTISTTINRLVLRYVEFHKYQHGFTKYNGTEQAIVEVSHTILNSHKFIAVLDLIKAYDRVSRTLLYTVCHQRLTNQHMKMAALLLQPLAVQTSKDITNTSATVTIGVPQGESFSCTLFNIFQDTLLHKLSSVPHHISDKAASALADDVIVMSKTAEGLQALLDICTEWAAEYQMSWNTSPGKSEVLLPPRGHQTTTFLLSGEQLRNVESSVYLGVSLTTSGVTDGKHIMRVKSAQRRLMQLSPIGIHIRGFNTNLCVMLYRVFVRSIYEYGLHLVPLTLSLKLVISRLESCFFRLVLGKVASRFGSSRLPRLRSLCRLESVDVRRVIIFFFESKHFIYSVRNVHNRETEQHYLNIVI